MTEIGHARSGGLASHQASSRWSRGAARPGAQPLAHREPAPLCARDFTYDEDRCRAWVRHLPRNLACLTNVAIAIVRTHGRFRYLPEANRHYAARAQEALDAVLIAPIA